MNGKALNVNAFRCTSPGYGSHAQIVECNHCGFVYANPRWSNEKLLEAYTAVEDLTYLQEREGRELTFQKHLQALEKHTGPANGRSLLDIGAYIGVFVETAVAAGWNACGVEPSDWAAAEAQKHGIKVIQGTQDAPEIVGQQFDIITLWDVIEHVDDPMEELTKALRRLKPGGWLAVHTMDIDSLTAHLMGPRWPWLMDMHLFFFSQKTMAAMLEKIGYEVVWSGAQGRYLRLGYLASRVTAWSKPLGRLASGLVNGLHLNKLAVPVNFGDLFTVYARRPLSE
ncbi:MAG: class I SAM-dependent methyltransferase [Ardenticatenaceae bacterium]|nr:class I SAM-dependent methyltransferase [Ardenticatenaceae bacterium]MCB9446354.1 class I SAM-dependent methyltransferase [Ardenticatenaceae bacterium]